MSKGNDRFAQVEKWVGVALLTLAILVTFGSLAQRRQPQVAVAPTPSAPWPTPATEAYPGPYPPPASPIPTPAPTAIPTPMPTLPIAPNLGIIWAETRFTSGEESRPEAIDFWESPIANLLNKHRLFSLQEGHQLRNVELSPDGQRIAFVTCPRIGCDDDETVLWIARKDGSELRNVAQGVDKFAQYIRYPVWSPDSQAVAYIKSVLKTPAPVDKDTEPAIREVFVAPSGGGEPRLLVADDLLRQVLGWSQGGESLFYEHVSPGVGYELWAVATNIRISPQRMLLLPEHYAFSPDGTRLLAYDAEEGFIVLSVDGKNRKVLVPPDQAFGGIWSVDGTEFIGRQGWKGQFRALDVDTAATRMLVTASLKEVSDTVLSVSPDRQWILIQSQSYGELYLLQVGSTLRIDVPGTGPMNFVGWINQPEASPR